MQTEIIPENKRFIGRSFEQEQLKRVAKNDEASVIILYGRRRVGKTELLEQTFRNRSILKFEGMEGAQESTQHELVMRQLSKYSNDPLLAKVRVDSWLDVFEYIAKYTQKGTWTIYFEEVQWLANYNDNFISQLKIAWDNAFRRNSKVVLILCGSSPSFMVQHVLHSKSLYNRSQYELHLGPFSINETRDFLKNKSNIEVMNAYLTVGGMPEYLKKVKQFSSVFTGICHHSFLPNSYFLNESERIFVSSMSNNPYYEQIINFLSQNRFATREQIAKHLNFEPGGRLSILLTELALCGLIKKYAPYNLAENSKLTRYQIADPYLQFFFKFINPQRQAIESGRYQDNPTQAINMNDYHKWLGYSFERYCRDNHNVIAKLLGFSGVKYQAGVFYNRKSVESSAGYQIDLLFDRSDHVVTICEIKYLQRKVGTEVIAPFDRQISLFQNKSNKTIHKVLVCNEGADSALLNRNYFDAIITLDDLMA